MLKTKEDCKKIMELFANAAIIEGSLNIPYSTKNNIKSQLQLEGKYFKFCFEYLIDLGCLRTQEQFGNEIIITAKGVDFVIND